MTYRSLKQVLDERLKSLFHIRDDDRPDGLDLSRTAYQQINNEEYKAEDELAEKYRSFVSEIMRLSLAAIGLFSFVISNLKSPISNLCVFIAFLGIAFLGFSIFFAMRFLLLASEGLRWYIAGLRYLKSEDLNTSQRALEKRRGIIDECRHDKLWAAFNLLAGAVLMAFATICAFI